MKSFWGNGIYGVWDFITIQRKKTFGIGSFPPVVISAQDPPEHRHLRPVEMAFTADCAAFFPCSPEALICVQQPCLIALSWPLAVSPPPASALVCSRVQIGRFCSTTAVCHNRDHLLRDTRNSPPRCLHANPWPFHCCGCSSCGRWHAGGVHEKGGSESAISRPDLSASTFFFFWQRSEIISLVCLFFCVSILMSLVESSLSWFVSLKRNRSGEHVFCWKLLSYCWQQKKPPRRSIYVRYKTGERLISRHICYQGPLLSTVGSTKSGSPQCPVGQSMRAF